MGPAFDLLAAYEPGGFFLERAGIGVAGSGGGDPWIMTLSGRQMGAAPPTLEMLFSGLDVGALPAEAPAPLLFGSIPFDPERSGHFVHPRRTVRRDRDGETWALRLDDERDAASYRAHAPGQGAERTVLGYAGVPGAAPRGVSNARSLWRSIGSDAGCSARSCSRGRYASRRAATLDPRELLKRLRAVEPDGYSFAIDIGEGRTLVGASPELLISRFGDEIQSEPARRVGAARGRSVGGSPQRRAARDVAEGSSGACDRRRGRVPRVEPLCVGSSPTIETRNSWPPRTSGTSPRGSAVR